MPLVRPCRRRWCPEYAGPDGWCDAHRRPPFYSSEPLPPGWPAIRADQLARHPRCQDCGAVATEVHHVRGRAAGDGPDNLASLCSTCHARITHREAGWLSRP
ncbi:MAG: HNH endonuclease [Streptosporangiaceae bacterium]